MKKEKFTIEFVFNSCSHPVLWDALSTPEGLRGWFADDAQQQGDVWTFVWNGSEQKAHRVSLRFMKSIRFRWDDESRDTFFEFKISEDSLTGNVTLFISDFADEEDVDDSKLLWKKQVNVLGRKIGAIIK